MKKIRKVFEEELIGGEYYSFEVVVWYWEIEDSGSQYAPPSFETEVVDVDVISLSALDRDVDDTDYEKIEEWVREYFVERFF
jgi:hypothetical protein